MLVLKCRICRPKLHQYGVRFSHSRISFDGRTGRSSNRRLHPRDCSERPSSHEPAPNKRRQNAPSGHLSQSARSGTRADQLPPQTGWVGYRPTAGLGFANECARSPHPHRPLLFVASLPSHSRVPNLRRSRYHTHRKFNLPAHAAERTTSNTVTINAGNESKQARALSRYGECKPECAAGPRSRRHISSPSRPRTHSCVRRKAVPSPQRLGSSAGPAESPRPAGAASSYPQCVKTRMNRAVGAEGQAWLGMRGGAHSAAFFFAGVKTFPGHDHCTCNAARRWRPRCLTLRAYRS